MSSKDQDYVKMDLHGEVIEDEIPFSFLDTDLYKVGTALECEL
jgi:hypothetical protein